MIRTHTPERLFTLDARSVTLGRIFAGTLLLIDLAFRATALEAHYSDAGVLPRDAFAFEQWDWAWSAHALSGSVAFEAALFALTAAALVAFTFGRLLPWSNLVAWLLYVSLCARNPLLRDGQDDLGRLLLFWFLFLPTGGTQKGATRTLYSAGTFGLTVQVLVLYEASVLHKLNSPWWTSLEALGNVVRMRRYQTPLAQQLVGHTTALEAFTLAALALETFGPMLLLVFWHRPRARIAVIAAMICLHLGMWANIRIGIFPMLCVGTWLVFLPTWVWGPAEHRPARGLPQGVNAIAFGATVLVLLLGAQAVLHADFGKAVNLPARTVGLNQWWGVFAPTKAEGVISDGWYWAQGRTRDGQLVTVDLPYFTSSDAPPPMLAFATTRWRHLLANLTTFSFPPGSKQHRTQGVAKTNLARWLCRDWNREHPAAPLDQLNLFFFRHELGKAAPVTRELMGSADDACTSQ